MTENTQDPEKKTLTELNCKEVTRLAKCIGDTDSNIAITITSPATASEICWQTLAYQSSNHQQCCVTITKGKQNDSTINAHTFRYKANTEKVE